MQIGILNTDTIKPEFATKYGQYPAMFKRMLQEVDPSILTKVYEVQLEEYPKDENECDAFLVTGSKVSAYEDLPWINKLKEFIQSLHANKKKIIGICFGHQLIAEALGGIVIKSNRGWHVGVDSVKVNDEAKIFGIPNDVFNLIYNHQDEVHTLPENAKLLASSENCPIGMMSIDNHILSFQGHIEFKKNYAKDLLDMRKDILGETIYKTACNSLNKETDDLKVTGWILNFLK